MCDCEKAIDVLTVHHELVKHLEAIGKVQRAEEQSKNNQLLLKL